jgi:hypothetical protein
MHRNKPRARGGNDLLNPPGKRSRSVLMLRRVSSQRLSEHRFGRDMRDILEIIVDRRPRDDEPHEIRGF